ncbi:hypothetical protein VCRA2114O232_340036 [Vibrio crassostreae]|nr:hypothetical protein VCRA2113O198_340036 [Vibrio crassostreae]CAK2341036.1 hypothetical protein VCRA2114O232_340036 [Vibrio crassostreae]
MIWQGWRDSNSQHADLEFYKTSYKNRTLRESKKTSNSYFRIFRYFIWQQFSKLGLLGTQKLLTHFYPKLVRTYPQLAYKSHVMPSFFSF